MTLLFLTIRCMVNCLKGMVNLFSLPAAIFVLRTCFDWMHGHESVTSASSQLVRYPSVSQMLRG